MKKLIALFISLLFVTPALAEDGMFIPSFDAFMDSFYAQVKDIDGMLTEKIEEHCIKDGAWCESDRLYADSYRVKVYIEEAHGFLSYVLLDIGEDHFAQNEPIVREIVIAASRSLMPDKPEEFFDELFTNINFDYVAKSPAHSVSMYTNFGLVQYDVMKIVGDYRFRVGISLYEH